MGEVEVDGLEEVRIDGACEGGNGLQPQKDKAVQAGDWCGRGSSHGVLQRLVGFAYRLKAIQVQTVGAVCGVGVVAAATTTVRGFCLSVRTAAWATDETGEAGRLAMADAAGMVLLCEQTRFGTHSNRS